MSTKKVENTVEETVNEEVKNVKETAVKETAVDDTLKAEEPKEEVKAEDPVKEDEVKEVKAKKVTIKNDSSKVKLKVLIAFTDKYTDESYKVNDEILFDKDRAKELLTDSRRLVMKQD